MLEEEKGKRVRTYADVVSAGRATYRLSNGEDEINSKKYLEKSLFLK